MHYIRLDETRKILNIPGQPLALKYKLEGILGIAGLRELPCRHDSQHRMFLGGEQNRGSGQPEAEANKLYWYIFDQ